MTEFAAIDLGASSGRVVIGRLADGVISLEELHRFPNRPVRLPDGLHWNLLHLFTEALEALRGKTLDGVGVDTWGVDYALLDSEHRVLGLPFHYRDERTEGAAGIGGYEVTGIQDMPINTVYQLLADDRMADAHAIALVPDLLAYWLSGELSNERTNASTTGLLDARTRRVGVRADRARRAAGAAVRLAGRAGRRASAPHARSTRRCTPSPRTTPPRPSRPRR